MDPEIWRDVGVVHCVVAADVQVRVRRGGRQRACDVHGPVARVHFAAGERDHCLARVVGARNLERAVPFHGALIVQLRTRVADATTCAIESSRES